MQQQLGSIRNWPWDKICKTLKHAIPSAMTINQGRTYWGKEESDFYGVDQDIVKQVGIGDAAPIGDEAQRLHNEQDASG